MRVKIDSKGRKIYISEKLRVAGSKIFGKWSLLCPEIRYGFPNEDTILDFITWAEATVPPGKTVDDFIC